jgi:hypothetical protein
MPAVLHGFPRKPMTSVFGRIIIGAVGLVFKDHDGDVDFLVSAKGSRDGLGT